jgi:hypothetical protein
MALAVRLGLLLGCLVFALGCGDDSGDEGAAAKLKGELRNSRLGYSLRYPADWRGGKGQQTNDVRALQGTGDRECIVAPVVGLPDWSSENGRRGYYEELARRRKIELESSGPVEGTGADGFTAVTASGSEGKRRLVRSATVASGGVGVSLVCSAPEKAFDQADADVFRPILSTVRVRRDEQAERLQSRLVQLDGVTAAGILRTKDRAQAQLRLANRDAGLPAVKATLELLVSELDAERVGVQGFKDPVNPVIGSWDARTKRAFVQAIPNPPERYTLED